MVEVHALSYFIFNEVSDGGSNYRAEAANAGMPMVANARNAEP